MEFMEWDGYQAFLDGEDEEEFYHIVFQDAPDYLWEHEQNRHEAELREEYRLVMDEFDLEEFDLYE